jgi:phage-related protein
MADSFGLKIGIEGEKEFKNALRDINQSFKVLGSEMKLVSSEFYKNDKSVQAVTARNEVLNKSIDAQKEKISTLESALKNASESFGENDRRTQNWAIQLNNAKAELNSMERELNQSTDSAGNLGDELKDVGDDAEKSSGKFEKFGGTLKGIGIAMGAVAVAAGAATFKLGKEVVEQFGELEQNLGGSEAVFGKYAASIQKTGEEAYKNLGVSQSQYLATANKMGALFQGSGIEQQKSLELTEKAMQRAADMASVMGIDMQMALDSVAGAAKGNFTMMDNLGVAMNATNIEAYAAGKGLDFVWSKASQAEKAEMAMRIFFESTEQYAGNFAKESTETITGSIGLLQAALGSFTAGLGNVDADMQNLTANLVDAFNAVIENVVPIIENLTKALPNVFATVLPAIGAVLPELLSTVVILFQQILDTLMKLLPELIPVAASAILTIVDALIENLPMLIDAAFELITTLAEGLITALPELVPKIVEVVTKITQTIIENLPLIIGAALQIVIALAAGIISSIPELVKAVPQLIGSFIFAFSDMKSRISSIGKDIVSGVWEGILSMASWFARQIKDFFGGIVDDVKSVLGIHSPSKVFAGIGEYMAEGLGQGFADEMQKIAKQIKGSIPTDFTIAGQYQASTKMDGNITNKLHGILPGQSNQPINLVITLDSKVIAKQIYDPLQNETRIRGRILAGGTI